MQASHAIVKTVSSINLVFGLDWFAILGGTVAREVRRIAREQKATHVVYAGDDASSAGVASLQTGKRVVLYSAAQLVAQRFSTGVVALILQLDDHQWWLVAIHEGAVIARTDYVCRSFSEASDLVAQLRQSYPALTVLNDAQAEALSLSELTSTLYSEAEVRRVSYGSGIWHRPFFRVVLIVLSGLVLHKLSVLIDKGGVRVSSVLVAPAEAWNNAVRTALAAHWVHGVTGTSDVLHSLYDLPVDLTGWQLKHAECVSRQSTWQCHADYERNAYDASNAVLLEVVPVTWDVSFTPLDHARVQWEFVSTGLSLDQSRPGSSQHTEHYIFSTLQAIRPAFSLINIEPPQPLRIPAPVDEHGVAIPQPLGLSQFRMRAVRLQGPLRSISVFLPHAHHMAWQRVVLSLNPENQPDLIRSRLNVTLHGVLYEQD